MELKRLIVILPSMKGASDAKDKTLLEQDEVFNKHLNDAIKKLKIKCDILKVYNGDMSFLENDNILTITSGEESLSISYDENESTVIWLKQFSMKKNRSYFYDLNYVLEAHNFLIINPLDGMCVSADKKKTFEVFTKYNIPQPKTIVLKASDAEDAEEFYKTIDVIYGNSKEDNKFVVKILDGHGGTGIFICTRKNIHSIMQAMFQIVADAGYTREFLVQKKEDGKDGDLRVHVLTINGQQRIIGAIRRHGVKNDFRSNISLGADASAVKLTKEQEQIALDVAKVSNLPWCAVDIMELVDGRNVVLEYNSSAGTGGISRTLNINFVEVLLKNIKEMFEKK